MHGTGSRRRWVRGVALALAATMVASVVAAGVAVPAAGNQQEAGPHHTDYEYDANATSGQRHWIGQELYVQGASGDEGYALYEVDEGQTGEFERQIGLGGDGAAVVDTGSLAAGEYVLLDGDREPVETDESGVRVSGGAGAETTVETASFHLVEQTLDARTDSESVSTGNTVDVRLDSNRADYAVEITADGLSADELASVFGGTQTDDGTRIQVSDAAPTADLSGVDPGDYEFEFDVTDSDADASLDLTVADRDNSGIQRQTIDVASGGVARIDIGVPTGDEGKVYVGSTDVGYLSSVAFEDADRSGDVTLRLNTSLAGNRTDTGEQAAWSVGGSDELDDTTLHTRPLSDSLAPAVYPMNLTANGVERDVAALRVASMSVEEATTHTAPDGDVDGALPELTRADRVAVGDAFAVRIDGAGLSSLLDSQSGDTGTEQFRSLVASDDATFTLTEVGDGVNGQREEVELAFEESVENDGIEAVTRDGTLYVVLDESDLRFESGDIRAGSEYEAEFTVTDESEFTDDSQTVTATATFTERSVSFRSDGDELELPATSNAAITGTTTAAPGTEIEVQVRSNGTVHDTANATVSPDRTFTAAVDLSALDSGTEVSVTAERFDDEVTGVVEPAAADRSANETTTTGTESGPGTTATATESTPTDSNESQSTTTDEQATDGENSTQSGPGFGALLAVLALLGIGLLAAHHNR